MHLGLNIGLNGQLVGGLSLPDFDPTTDPNLLGWWDAADAGSFTLTGSLVEQWNDKSGNGNHMTPPAAANRPTYEASNSTANSNAAVVFPDNSGSVVALRTASSLSVAYAVFVLAYRTGFSGNFLGLEIIARSSSTEAIAGDSGTGNLGNSTATFVPATGVSVNGAADSLTVLPLPLSVMEIEAPADERVLQYLGNRSALDRGWRGPICEVFWLSATPSGSYLTDMRNYLYAKWGITP